MKLPIHKHFLLFISIFWAYSSCTNHETAIIFDLGGLLIETDSLSVVWHSGPLKWLYYLTHMQNPSTVRDKLYLFLETIEPDYCPSITAYDETGKKLPVLMQNWLAGKQSSYDTITAIRHALPYYFVNDVEYTLFDSLITTIFDPTLFAQTRRFIDEGIMFVKECIMHGYQVYILSNWDPDSFKLLQEMYPSFFELFDGIMISGQIGYNKPDPHIYHALLKQYHLCPSDCIFIDDQAENIAAAQSIGIYGIKCPTKKFLFTSRPDFDVVRKKVHTWLTHRENIAYQVSF